MNLEVKKEYISLFCDILNDAGSFLGSDTPILFRNDFISGGFGLYGSNGVYA